MGSIQLINDKEYNCQKYCLQLEDDSRVMRVVCDLCVDCFPEKYEIEFYTDEIGNKIESPLSIENAIPCLLEAINVLYDNTNTASILTINATNVQHAIEQIDATTSNLEAVSHNPLTLNADDPTQQSLILNNQELTIKQATPSTDGVMSSEDKTKIDSIESGSTGDQLANEVPYNNSTSGLSAVDVQEAIDETEARVEISEGNITSLQSDLSDHVSSVTAHPSQNITYSNAGLVSTNVKDAIDEIKSIFDDSDIHDHVTLNASDTTQETITLNNQEVTVNLATQSTDGVMSAEDKLKLDNVANNANNYVHPNHTGDILSTGDGATVISSNSVGNTKLSDMLQSTVKGRASNTGLGDPQDLNAVQLREIINVEDGAQVNIVNSVAGKVGAVTLDTNDVAESSNLYFTENRVINSQIDGFVSTQGAIISTDSILTAIGKLDGNISAINSSEDDLSNNDTDDLSEGSVNLYYTETRVTNNSSVLANTAKVSADGSVTTHSDVTDAGSGIIISNDERSKLAGIENGATADQTGSEIKSLYESEPDTNAFTDAEKTKLSNALTNTVIDDDTFTTATPTSLASSQSIKAYVDAQIISVNEADEVIFDPTTSSINDATVNVQAAIVETVGRLDTAESSIITLQGSSHDAVTVTDSSEIDFTLTGQDITASLVTGSIDVLKLDSGVQTSLSLADSALQSFIETDPVFTASQAFNIDATDITNLSNLSGTNTGDQDLSGYVETTDINTLAELNAIITDATLIDTTDSRLSDARTPLAHTHVSADITDIQATISANSSVTANTAKVSADGSVSTHSDVDVAGATNGQVLTFNSTSGNWEPTAPGAAPVDSVNTQTGVVVLDADDIDDTSTAHKFVTAGDVTTLSNTSGTNTGDETLSSIQTKRPLKTVEGQSLEGSGDINLTASDVGLGNVDNTSDANKPISTATQTALDDKADLVAGKVPASQLPSFVDDVIEAANFASLPVGETGKIYITLDDNKTYRWTGSVYVEVGSNDVNSVNGETGIVVLTTGDIAEDTNKNYVTDADLTTLSNTSGINTGDQDLSGYSLTTHTHTASDITDFDTEVSNNASVTANTAKISNATHTGDVTGDSVLTIANDAVTNTKSADMAQNTIKGRISTGSGDPEDLTATQIRTIINVEDGATADQTSIVGITGTKVEYNTSVTDGNFMYIGDAPTSHTHVEADITLSDNTTNDVSTLKHGFMSKLPGTTTVFYRGDGTFAAPAATTVANAYVIQAFTDTTYNLVHNLGSYPVVQVLDSTGAVVIPLSIVNNTANDLTVTFTTTGTYTIIATLGSPQLQAYVSTAVDYSALVTDRIIEVTGENKTVTLPTANVSNVGYVYIIDNSSVGTTSVVGQGGELIQGQATQSVPPSSSMSIYANGTAWRII